jgi:hypothetical protein
VVQTASSKALASNDANDSTYNSIEGQIQSLTTQRDALVAQMIGLLNGAEFKDQSFVTPKLSHSLRRDKHC